MLLASDVLTVRYNHSWEPLWLLLPLYWYCVCTCFGNKNSRVPFLSQNKFSEFRVCYRALFFLEFSLTSGYCLHTYCAYLVWFTSTSVHSEVPQFLHLCPEGLFTSKYNYNFKKIHWNNCKLYSRTINKGEVCVLAAMLTSLLSSLFSIFFFFCPLIFLFFLFFFQSIWVQLSPNLCSKLVR